MTDTDLAVRRFLDVDGDSAIAAAIIAHVNALPDHQRVSAWCAAILCIPPPAPTAPRPTFSIPVVRR